MSDPFGYGYAVSHIGDPFCLWWWLCGQSLRTIGSDTTDRLYIFLIYGYGHGYGIWLLGDYGSIWLYDISLTHIRP